MLRLLGAVILTILPLTALGQVAIEPVEPGEGGPVVVGPGAGPVREEPADPKAKLTAAVSRGAVVMVATVDKVVAGMQTMSEPPTVFMAVSLKEPEMLKGDKPASLDFSWSAVKGHGFEPAADQKVIAVLDKAPVAKPRPAGPAGGMPPPEGRIRMDGPARLGMGNAGPRISFMIDASNENVALARKAAELPAGWSFDKDGKPLSPFASLGDKAWPKGMKFKPDSKIVCAKTARPALLAGKGAALKVEQVPPATPVKWKNDYGDGKFTVTVTNTSDKPLEVPALLTDGKTIFWADCLVVTQGDTPHLLGGAGSLTPDAKPIKLDPGKGVAAAVNVLTLDGISWPRGGSRVAFRFCLGELAEENFFYYHMDLHDGMRRDAAKLPAVESLAASVSERVPAGDWANLFADEKWYKDQKSKEQEFTGKLEAVPNADGPSTLMRTSFYKLGDRTIHTGARKLPALDGLVGKDVVIRGKPVEMNLEGQSLAEIWPAAIRAAK